MPEYFAVLTSAAGISAAEETALARTFGGAPVRLGTNAS